MIAKTYKFLLELALVVRQKDVFDDLIPVILQDVYHKRAALVLIFFQVRAVGKCYDGCGEGTICFKRKKLNLVTRMDHSLLEDLRENSLARHDAVTHLVVDSAMAVTLLSDLREAEQRAAYTNLRTDGDRPEIKTFHDEIFAESTEIDICSLFAKLFYLLKGEKADLAMPFFCVRVPLDPPVRNQVGLLDLMLLCPFFFAYAYSKYFSYHKSSLV